MSHPALVLIQMLFFGAVAIASGSPSPSPTPVVIVQLPPGSVAVTVAQSEDWWLIAVTAAVALAGLIAALAAILVALDWPRSRLKGPVLSVSSEEGPPDRHLINTFVDVSDSADELVLHERPAYYCRLRVANAIPGRFGRLEARDVEVQLIRLLIHGSNETVDPVFLPIRLTWSHVHGPVRDRILPGLYNHADLLRIIADDDGVPWLEFLTEVSPNAFPSGEIPNVKGPGRYRLEFAAAASNAPTAFYCAEIEWSGVLDEQDADRMKSELKITVAPRNR